MNTENMKLEEWIPGPGKSGVARLIKNKWNEDFVQKRLNKNVGGKRPPYSHGFFWEKMTYCLLTTQQRSGSDYHVMKFMSREPFPLSLEACEEAEDRQDLIQKEIHQAGLRFNNNISKYAIANLELLQNGGWDMVDLLVNRLKRVYTNHCKNEVIWESDKMRLERETARALMGRSGMLKGFGPKQARNLLQMLGLTRFEIPIDSRFCKWLKKSDFPVPVPPAALSRSADYEWLEDEVIFPLCQICNIYPCILDAMVFRSEEPSQCSSWNGCVEV